MVVGGGIEFKAREDTFPIFEIDLLIAFDSYFKKMKSFHWADCGLNYLYFALDNSWMIHRFYWEGQPFLW